ncbi:MAG: AzlD domain-containing protein [Clostridia bacterium]|nr:AzlD domain-containing protein [Clostridia bacterium]
MTYLLVSLLVMALVSVLPRVLPLVLIRKKIKSRFIKSFLFYMPYAVLTSLTVPYVFYSTGSIITASIGTAVAVFLSFFIKNKFYVPSVVCVILVFGLSFAF